SSGHIHGFLDSRGTITTIDVTGSLLTEALAINDSGQIVGLYEDSSGNVHGFLATAAVPAPTMLDAANLALLSQYSTAMLSPASDGAGGPLITDPPAMVGSAASPVLAAHA